MFNVYSLKDWGCPLGSPMNPVKKCQVMLVCASLKFDEVLMLVAQVGDPLSLYSFYEVISQKIFNFTEDGFHLLISIYHIVLV